MWSPTGDRIAFVSHANELAVLGVASGTVVPLADVGASEFPSTVKFSPEGNQILFSKQAGTGAMGLWSVHTDGSDLHRLVAGSSWGDWQTVFPTR